MYSTTTILKNSKHSGRIIGTHQKLDRIARRILGRQLPPEVYFPSIKEILHFEGTRGPDGLKRKSPGVDEPMHFIIPNQDDGKLLTMILDHRHNLNIALKERNETRASFEAAWMAHAITDGLTPAHHFPLAETTAELMTEKELIKIFGAPVKGIMHGKSLAETARNNWLYWGANGHMNKHLAFEYGVALVAATAKNGLLMPEMERTDFYNIDLKKEFYRSLNKVATLKMYHRFREQGWTTDLAIEAKERLLPEIIKAIALGWASAVPELNPDQEQKQEQKT